MQNKPLVTIVTVTYNLIEAGREEFFRQCLESVHNQTYENIEHIVIDGASTDGTLDLIKEYQKKRWITYISEKDDGIYDAMNKGVKKANGKYIAFLNSDDYYLHDNVVKLSVNKLVDENADFSYGKCVLKYEEHEDVMENNIDKFLFSMPFGHPTMFTKADVLKCEGMFNKKYGLPADYGLIVKIILKDYKGVFVDDEFVGFRVIGPSSFEDYSNEIAQIYIDNYSTFYKFIDTDQAKALKYKKEVPSGFIEGFKSFAEKKNYNNIDIGKVLNNLKLLAKEKKGRSVRLKGANVIANLATFPERTKKLKIAIKSILNQVDEVNIYLNEYKNIPNFLKHPRINCVLGRDVIGDLKDNGKFYFLDKVPENSYYFTIDDDIIYPENYVAKMVGELKKYDNNVVVGVHGIIFSKKCRSFVNDRNTYDYRNYLFYDRQVSVLGTGTIAFYKRSISDIDLKHFSDTGMTDLFFARYCQQKNIPLIAINRKKQWLKDVSKNNAKTTLWDGAVLDDKVQTNFILDYKLWDINKIITEEDGSFSVVVPCYNLGKLLPKAINSVLSQTLKNVEMIVVDDASTDEQTKRILKDVEQDVNIIYLKENKGVANARNIGIKKAQSEYILCLDADDTIESTYLEKAKNIFDADKNVGIVSCGLQSVGGSNEKFISKDKISVKDALVNSPVHTASCFRKEAHDQCGGYDIKLRGYEDWNHWIDIMKNNWTVRVIPEYLFNYYVRPNSKVNTSNKNAFELVSKIIENHKDLYDKNFAYVIAKKHAEWAKVISVSREKSVNYNWKTKIIDVKKRIFPKKWF